jgi:hypothetical protein
VTNYLKPIEQRVINGKTFNVFRSPNNKYIQKVGTNEIYGEAVDLAYLDNKYIETDEVIEDEAN